MYNKQKILSVLIAAALTASCSNLDRTSKHSSQSNLSQQNKQSSLFPFSKEVPSPSSMNVDVVTNGRVSTLKSIDVVKVGKNIPYTYSWGKVNNTPGYDWYVSKHFALKSNRPEDQVKLYMELLESAYPHYIELFGDTPPDLENTRMAAVYGSSKQATKIFVPDDNITRGISAGGEAMFYNLVGYSFPSAREQHQRYIVVHEQGHVFQMALMDYSGWLPTWFTEGTADALAHHYYDPELKQLKVMVFDRASPMDYIRRGIEEYEALGHPTIEDMTNNPKLYRGVNFLIVHFMLDDPDRSHKFKAYRDEMAAMRQSDYDNGKALSHQLMMDIFGDWAQVEKDFAEYVKQVNKTFNVAAGPWEQDGNKLWVRTLNNNYEHGSPRIDVLLKPADKPSYDFDKFDQPLSKPSDLTLKAKRGVENPILALEIEYQKEHLHRGYAGIGLGLKITDENTARLQADKKVGTFEQKSYKPDEDELLRIKLVAGNTIVIDGTSLGYDKTLYALPKDMVDALERAEHPKLGISVVIEDKVLSLHLKTKDHQHFETYDLSEKLRDLLINRPMALLAEGAAHRITSYFDDGRDLNPDKRSLLAAGSVNPWANPADRAISRLFRAKWRLGNEAPPSLAKLYDFMIEQTPKSLNEQLASLIQYQTQLPSLVDDIANSKASPEQINRALVELSGINLRLEWRRKAENGEQTISAVVNNKGLFPTTGTIKISQDGYDSKFSKEALEPSQKISLDLVTTQITRNSNQPIYTTAELEWLGKTLRLEDTESARKYPWSSMDIVKQAKLNDGIVQLESEFRGPHAGETKGKMRLQAYPSNAFVNATIEKDVSVAPYEIKHFKHSFEVKPGFENKLQAIDVEFEVVIDGEPVLLKQRSLIN